MRISHWNFEENFIFHCRIESIKLKFRRIFSSRKNPGEKKKHRFEFQKSDRSSCFLFCFCAHGTNTSCCSTNLDLLRLYFLRVSRNGLNNSRTTIEYTNNFSICHSDRSEHRKSSIEDKKNLFLTRLEFHLEMNNDESSTRSFVLEKSTNVSIESFVFDFMTNR